MNSLGIVIFIIFMIFRAVSGAQKNQKGRGEVPQQHFPNKDFPQQTTNQQRPWWEEWDDAEEEKQYFPPVKQTKPEPVKIKEEPVRKKQFIEAKAQEKNIKSQQKEMKKKNVNPEQPETMVPNLDADQVRQGIIWAEILQPPKAKRKYRT